MISGYADEGFVKSLFYSYEKLEKKHSLEQTNEKISNSFWYV